MDLDLDQAREFIHALTGCENAPVTWQTFYDPKKGIPPKGLAKNFIGVLDDNIDFFTSAQKRYAGVYVALNIMDGKGRTDSNVVGFRGLFADFDDQEEPDWPIRPHITTMRDTTHGHAIWLVDDILTKDEFSALQLRIATFAGTDPCVYDPPRVIRVPGFNHYKDLSYPKQYRITSNHSTTPKYKKIDIINSFPITPTQAMEIDLKLSGDKHRDLGSGYSNSPGQLLEFERWASKTAPVAVEGSGTLTLYKTASVGHDRGVELKKAQDILWDLYNPRCDPPWEENEKRHFLEVVARAYKYAKSSAGNKSPTGSFLNCCTLPPQDHPVQNHLSDEENDRSDTSPVFWKYRVSKRQGEVLLSQMVVKSAHYDLARAFDAVEFNGKNLLRCDKIMYSFNGKSWDQVNDTTIRSRLQRFYSCFKPSDSFTRGVFSVLCDMVNIDSVENGEWLVSPPAPMGNPVSFNNGLVDVSSRDKRVIPHLPEYFCFNHLPYDYDDSSKCDKWLLFLNDLWGGDDDMKRQLQEFMGYCMTTDITRHKFALLIGKSRAGKGVITDVMKAVIGEGNTCAPTLNSIPKDEMLHAMSKSTLALIPDAHNVAFNLRDEVLSVFKGLTGGDAQTFNVKFKDAQTKTFKCRFVLSTNGMPEFSDSSGALMNRALVFPFNKSFAGKENYNLRSELLAELPGIAKWAIEGLERLNLNGRFTESESGVIEKEQLKDDMSPLSLFVSEMCEIDESSVTPTQVLYSAYNLWSTVKSIRNSLSEIQFSKMLRGSDMPITHKRHYYNGKRVGAYSGIKLSAGTLNKLAIGQSTVDSLVNEV